MMQRGAKGQDPFDGVNIEEVFAAMETLARRELFEAAPFISGWHPIVDELDTLDRGFRVRHELSDNTQMNNGGIARSIDSALKGQPIRPVGNEIRTMVENSLRHLRTEISGGGESPGGGTVFRSTCTNMMQKLIGLVWIKPAEQDRVAYLRPLVRYASKHRSPIATLNYDTTIEVAAKAEDIFVDTSKVGGPASDDEAEYMINLIKPHGSIDWCSGERHFPDDVLPQARILQAEEEEMGKPDYSPAVIFGQRNKLTAAGPFLSLFSAFQEELENSRELVIIGYSFRDNHINESVATWMNHDERRKMIIVTPDKDWSHQSEFAGRLSSLATPGGRVGVVQNTAAEAIPGLFPAE